MGCHHEDKNWMTTNNRITTTKTIETSTNNTEVCLSLCLAPYRRAGGVKELGCPSQDSHNNIHICRPFGITEQRFVFFLFQIRIHGVVFCHVSCH